MLNRTYIGRDPADTERSGGGDACALFIGHLKTSETVVCLEGCLEWVFYEELPNMDAGGPFHDCEVAADESCFVEVSRFRVCPREGQYGIQVPLGAWHSVVALERSTILEAKDGGYGAGM